MTERKIIYTIGHSTHPIGEFVQLLQTHEIRCLADIRRFPTSKKYPQFTRENLAQTLTAVEIEYVWLGEQLGGFRTGGYESYMQTETFRTGLKQLAQLASQTRTAFMCAELLFFRCHRRFVADQLIEQDWRVFHIIDQARLYEHQRRERPLIA
jgi:uncharacterized protein (DUF488 family)